MQGGAMGKNPPDNAGDARDMGSIPRSGRCSRGENKEGSHQEQPSPVVLPGESHGQRSLEGYSPWGVTKGQTSD